MHFGELEQLHPNMENFIFIMVIDLLFQ